MRRRKRRLSIFKILALILFLASLFMSYIIYKVNLLPDKYLYLVLGGIAFINIFFDIFLMRKKARKGVRGFFAFLTIVVLGVMAFFAHYILNTLGFLAKIGPTDYKTETYSVIVVKDSEYNKIKDIKDLNVAYYSNSKGAKDANKKVLKNVDVNFKDYDDANEMASKLLNNEEKVIMLEDSVLSMVNEDDPEFNNKTKVIYKFVIKIKSNTKAKDVNVTRKPFNIYITGIDTYGEISSVSRSDVNIVATVNPKTKQVLLTSIPRDYYVQLHGTTGIKDKLTHAGIYGVDMSIATIEDLLDIEINYYVKVNFTSLIDIVNALGGITVYSDYTFTSIDGVHFTEGNNNMNGEQALAFARERKAFQSGDIQRGKDQQAVIAALIKKVCSKSIITKYDSLLNSLKGKFQTNMSSNKITSLLKMQLNDMSTWNISTYNLDGVNSNNYTYSGGNMKLFVFEPKLGSIEQAHNLINDVINGKKLEPTYTYDGPATTATNNYSSKEETETKEEKKEETNTTKEEIKQKKDIKDYMYPACKNQEDGMCLIETDDVDVEEPICTGDPEKDEDGIETCSVDLTCPKDYKMNNGKCTKANYEKKPVCETNYHYEKLGMVCCPDNYSYDASIKACVAE